MRTSRLTVCLALLLAACASTPITATSTGPTPTSSVPTPTSSVPTPPTTVPTPTTRTPRAAGQLPDALIEVNGALMAVQPSGTNPVWTLDRAVASANGAAAFRVVDNAKLVRYNTATAAPTGEWRLPAGAAWRVAVVDISGSHVVLTDGVVDGAHRVSSTRLAVWNARSPDSPHVAKLTGTIEPEAVSPDGSTVYVLDHRSTYYRVRAFSVNTGELNDTYGQDKSPPEDMHGEPIRAVPSPDGQMLSTLYRVPGGSHEPFVHVLHLEQGWSYCADLPQGTYTSMTASLDGRTLYIGATDGSWLTLNLGAIQAFAAVPVDVHRASQPPVPLAAGGAFVSERGVVAADSVGVVWYRDGQPLARLDQRVDRLITLAS